MEHISPRARFERRLVIVSGPTDKVEDELNALMDSHTALSWNWDVVDGRHLVSVVLLKTDILEKQLRMQQLANAGMMQKRPM
jgi:hypothetical protein